MAREPARRSRALDLALGAVLVAATASAVAAILVTGRTVSRPVVGELGGERVDIAVVSVAWAMVVLLGWTALARLLRVRGMLRIVEFGITAPVTVFLIAQLNGITEVTALVPLYALGSVPALLAAVQHGDDVRRGHQLAPMIVAAAVGIVPWGVIAFAQIGAGLVGGPPDLASRIVTLVALAFSIAQFVVFWREAAHRTARGAMLHAVLATASVVAVAAIVLTAVP